MRKVLVFAFALLASLSSQAEVWQARYGVAEIFNFKLYNADGTLDVDEADGGTEVSLSCNEGAETTATNDFVDEGSFYSISLTATEMQCERVAVVVAATEREVFFIQTVGNASALTPFMPADVQQFGGSAGTFSAGIPSVNTSQISGSSTPAVNLGTSFSESAGPVALFGIVDQGTAQSATATTVVLRSAATFADDTLIGRTICVLGSTQGYYQCGAITDSVLSTDTVTVPTWTVTPSGTITYKIWGTASGTGSVTIAAGGISASSFAAGAIDAAAIASDAIGAAEVANATIDAATFAAAAIDAAAIAADAIGASEIATDAITSTEIASGSIGAAEIGTAALDADAIATDAIGSAELATTAVDEIWASTCTEPAAKPAWGSSGVKDWVCWLGAFSRNKVTQTSTTKTLRNDADNANLVTCAVSDDATTFTLSECAP